MYLIYWFLHYAQQYFTNLSAPHFCKVRHCAIILTMIRQIPDELKQKAVNELHEVPSRIEDDINHIREWIRKQPHLNFQMSEQLIFTFIRCCKFSLERTKKKIDNYYTMRAVAPEFFTNRDPFLPEMQLLLNAGVMVPMPKVDCDGCKIFFCNYSLNLNPNTMSLQNIAKLSYMIADILLLEDDYASINGLRTFMHCKDFDIKYIYQLTAPFLKKQLHIIQNGFPLKTKGIIVGNCASIFENAYRVARMFVSKKLSARFLMYSEDNISELYKAFPQHLLPEEMGGENGSLQDLIVTWKKKVESYREWFLKNEILKTNEKLRPGTPRTSSTVFGLEGSFRQLQID